MLAGLARLGEGTTIGVSVGHRFGSGSKTSIRFPRHDILESSTGGSANTINGRPQPPQPNRVLSALPKTASGLRSGWRLLLGTLDSSRMEVSRSLDFSAEAFDHVIEILVTIAVKPETSPEAQGHIRCLVVPKNWDKFHSALVALHLDSN